MGSNSHILCLALIQLPYGRATVSVSPTRGHPAALPHTLAHLRTALHNPEQVCAIRLQRILRGPAARGIVSSGLTRLMTIRSVEGEL